MDKGQIFHMVVQAALTRGWLVNELAHVYADDLQTWRIIEPFNRPPYLDIIFRHFVSPPVFDHEYDDYHRQLSFEEVVFNIDFAEALWSNREVCPECGENKKDGGFWHMPNYLYHLQSLALAHDRYKYLLNHVKPVKTVKNTHSPTTPPLKSEAKTKKKTQSSGGVE